MISKADLKILKALSTAHGRKKHQKFMVEGAKMVTEALLAKMPIAWLAATTTFLKANQQLLQQTKVYEVTEQELKQLSLMQQPNQALAVVNKPAPVAFSSTDTDWVLVLDGIQDPGNMGTIVRTAEWFGVNKILCSKETVDIFNPKVVQASMGSVFRMPVFYQDLLPILIQAKADGIPIHAALLEGKNIYKTSLPKQGYLIIGNEGKGISTAIVDIQPSPVYIAPAAHSKAESLNAAIATAVLLSAAHGNSF